MNASRTTMIALTAAALVACGDASAPGSGATVTLRFTMAPGAASLRATGSGLSLAQAAVAALPLAGTNGTLTVDDIRLVVDDVRLKSAADSCAKMGSEREDEDLSQVALHHGDPGMLGGDTEHDGDHGCEAAGAAPFFVAVPLDGDAAGQIGVDVGPGTYDEVELRTGAPDDSADADLLATIRNEFPDWPSGASMLVVGSFTPTDGDPVPFRVYFDARIKVEQEFKDNPLVVAEGNTVTVTVVVDPARWFTNADGTVQDLSMQDFDTTGKVVAFGMRSGEGCRIQR
jgi:hypothetical protein